MRRTLSAGGLESAVDDLTLTITRVTSDEPNVSTSERVVNVVGRSTAHARLRELDVEEERLRAEWERAWMEVEAAFY